MFYDIYPSGKKIALTTLMVSILPQKNTKPDNTKSNETRVSV